LIKSPSATAAIEAEAAIEGALAMFSVYVAVMMYRRSRLFPALFTWQ
jgi:hypothetical protein